MSAPAVALETLIAALSRPEAYPHPVDKVEVHQTHISVVFLAGPFAYKIKKPVNLGFLDFSTIERREHYCNEEVRLNRRLAPSIYLGVTHVARDGDRLQIRDQGVVIEPVVWMKRLPADATFESRLLRGELQGGHVQDLARRLARFHQQAESNERISSFGRLAVVADNARENFRQTYPHVGQTVSREVYDRVVAAAEAHLRVHHDLIEARARRGVPRDTHGDLHLDHVYLLPSEASPHDLVMIDCIEFADRFRYADPVADMAFLAMDLSFHGRRDLARAFVEAYFEASGDAEGRLLLPYYSAYRAIVRAKVEAIKLSEKEIDKSEHTAAAMQSRAHWLLALGELAEPAQRPALLLVAGLPGSGKSTLAKALAASAHFEVLRSDVLRKQLTASYPGENVYSEAWTERTYAAMFTQTEQFFWQGRRVLIDANFREDGWRRLFLDAAQRWCVPAFFIHCQAAPDVIRERLAARKNDASDADWKVYQTLQSQWQPLSHVVRSMAIPLDTSGQVGDSEAALRAALQSAGLL